MPNKNFLLLSLEDAKIKKVSNVISNDSCRKILDYLSDKESTETELAEKLGIPISTVHYNLQQLMETGLISAEEFHYSQKGKEVMHYKLANKYIVIAPKNTSGIREKLKSILPAVLIAAGAAGIIHFFTEYYYSARIVAPQNMMAAKSAAMDRMAESATSASQTAPIIQVVQPNIALWFLGGALFALLIYFVIGLFRKDSN